VIKIQHSIHLIILYQLIFKFNYKNPRLLPGYIPPAPTTAIISGNVTDQNGAILPNATLPEIVDIQGNAIVTDGNGNFQNEVNNGDYVINKAIVNGNEYPTNQVNITVNGDINIGTVVVNLVIDEEK